MRIFGGERQEQTDGHQVRADELLAVEGTRLTCIPSVLGVIVLHADVFLLERIGLFRVKSGKTDALRCLLHEVAQGVGEYHGLLLVVGDVHQRRYILFGGGRLTADGLVALRCTEAIEVAELDDRSAARRAR